ncbi:MAG: hypothetical protein ABIK61_06325 [candidate division WOR-3 bacterium]
MSHGGAISECDYPLYLRSGDGVITWTSHQMDWWLTPPLHSQSALVASGNKIIALFAPSRGIERVVSNNAGLSWSSTAYFFGEESLQPYLKHLMDSMHFGMTEFNYHLKLMRYFLRNQIMAMIGGHILQCLADQMVRKESLGQMVCQDTLM